MAINFQQLLAKLQEQEQKFPGSYAPIQDGIMGDIYNQTSQAPPTIDNTPIQVTGIQDRAVPTDLVNISPADLIPRSLGNRDFALEAQQANKNTSEAVQHKGMFGIKGTLRDILGTLGDAFLVQSGNKPEYSAVRQREREGDAMAGWTQDPNSAAERMAQVNPTMSGDIRKLAIDEQTKKATLDSNNLFRESMANKRDFDTTVKAASTIARLYASPQAQKNPPQAYEQAARIAQFAGINPAQLGIKPDMTAEEMQMFSAMDMNVNQTMNLPFTERRVSAAEQTADAATTRANRPPVGRAPPKPPSVKEQVDQAIMSGNATPAQQKYYEDHLPSRSKKKMTARPPGVGIPAGFKLGKKVNN